MRNFFKRPDTLDDPLYVCCVIFNATRFRTRWQLYGDFEKEIEDRGGILYTAEVAFGDREFSVTEANNPRHLQLRTRPHELWVKENVLRLLTERLPRDWKKVAFCDTDISWARGDIINETLHQLEHYDVVQMWSEAEDLSPDYEHIQTHHSFVYSWMNNEPQPAGAGYYYVPGKAPQIISWHPGFAWAWRREAFDAVGGLIDWAMLGAGDKHMADCLIGNAKETIHPEIQGSYRRWVMLWQDRALRYIKRNIGYVPGKIMHYWHGQKISRGYWTRWRILVDTNFDPEIDLKRDWQGLWDLVVESDRQQILRDKLRAYFRGRNEDGIDV